MPDGAPSNESFCDLGHRNGALNAGRHSKFFESILQGQRVDHRCEHSHVIAGSPLDPAFTSTESSKNVSATHYDHDLNPHISHLADLFSHILYRGRINSNPRLAT